jgi:hypothetical protein
LYGGNRKRAHTVKLTTRSTAQHFLPSRNDKNHGFGLIWAKLGGIFDAGNSARNTLEQGQKIIEILFFFRG